MYIPCVELSGTSRVLGFLTLSGLRKFGTCKRNTIFGNYHHTLSIFQNKTGTGIVVGKKLMPNF